MEQDQYLTLFQQYAVRMKEIRLLSTPDLNDIKDPDEFGRILAENFSKIGKLAIENRKIINDVIRGHHVWYDCSKGYPADFDTFSSPYKTIIDIVLAADCLDAATDTVGRSYNKGKTFDDYEKEIKEGAGTRYAPFLAELFARPEVREDLVYLLGGGRNRMYRELYMLLKQ